jgi:hypothetical protein
MTYRAFSCHSEMTRKMACPVSFLLVVMCCAQTPPLPLHIVLKLSLFAMPTKVDGRNEVGAIVHAVANRVLRDHTAKNIFGNVDYSKHFLQGTVVGVFDGRAPWGKNVIWKYQRHVRAVPKPSAPT